MLQLEPARVGIDGSRLEVSQALAERPQEEEERAREAQARPGPFR
jgi:hypothetical protein